MKGDKPVFQTYSLDHRPADEEIALAVRVNQGAKALIRTKHSLFLNEGPVKSAKVVTADYFASRNRNGSTYFYWQYREAHIYTQTKDGRIIMKYRSRHDGRGNGGRNTAFLTTTTKTPSMVGIDPTIALMVLQFFDLDGNGMAPMSNEYNGHLFSTFHDPRHLATYLFGKRKVRKDLVKAVANCGANRIVHLQVASLFRDLVPIDWIIKFLQTNSGHVDNAMGRYLTPMSVSQRDQRAFRAAILKMDPHNYRRILLNPERSIEREIQDVISSYDPRFLARQERFNREYWGRMSTARIRSFHEWHQFDLRWLREQRQAEMAARGHNQYRYGIEPFGIDPAEPRETFIPRGIPEYEIRTDPLSQALQGAAVGSATITLPAKTEDLYEWGDYMHNCIGSYAHRINNPDLILGAAIEDEKVVACFEINNGVLRQLLGRFNGALAEPKAREFEQFFQTINVETREYWGKPS